MNFVLSTSFFEAQRLPDLFPVLRQCGFDKLEVKDTKEFDTIPGLWNDILRASKDCDIEIPNWHLVMESPFQDTTIGRKTVIERMKDSMDKGTQLGAKNHVLHWFQRFRDPDCQTLWRHIVDEWVEHASRSGICLLMETVPDQPTNERYVPASEIVAFVKQYPPEVLACCLDVNHSNLREALPEAVFILKERLVSLHISDNDGKEEKHWLPGQGIIDFPAIFHALRKIGFEGMIVLEADKWCEDVHTLSRLQQLYQFGRILLKTGAPHPETPPGAYQAKK